MANKPSVKVRVGRISGAIWRSEDTDESGNTRVSYSIRIIKSYKDKKSGEWKDTDSFFPEDLPKLTLVSQKCYEIVALSKDGDL